VKRLRILPFTFYFLPFFGHIFLQLSKYWNACGKEKKAARCCEPLALHCFTPL